MTPPACAATSSPGPGRERVRARVRLLRRPRHPRFRRPPPHGPLRHHPRALGEIAVAFRDHAPRNPGAQKREPLTLEKYLAARLIVDPFGLYDCSLVTDGAARLVITSAERARDLPKPPASSPASASAIICAASSTTTTWSTPPPQQASRQASEMAGLCPQDVDCAQIYDCFTYMVLTQLKTTASARRARAARSSRPARSASAAPCPPTPPAASYPKATARACCRSSKPSTKCAATAPPTARSPTATSPLPAATAATPSATHRSCCRGRHE